MHVFRKERKILMCYLTTSYFRSEGNVFSDLVHGERYVLVAQYESVCCS